MYHVVLLLSKRRSLIPALFLFHTHSSVVVDFATVQMLDTLAGQKPQLTALEFTMLSMTVLAAGSGPWIGSGALTEFLAPAACACKHRFFVTVLIVFLARLPFF